MTDVPEAFAAARATYKGAAGRAFVAALPALAADFPDRWGLRPAGPPTHGVAALVLPVVARTDGTPAALELQLPDAETEGEPVALRTWDGDGAVRLLGNDPATGTLLLERPDPTRTLTHVEDSRAAVQTLAGLLAHLTATPAPPGLRRLADIVPALLERTPAALARVPDPADRRLLADCAAAVREVAPSATATTPPKPPGASTT